MELIALKLSTFDITVVVSGIGIVLATLIVLIIVFYAFGNLVSKVEASSKKRAQKKLEKKMQKTQGETVQTPVVAPTVQSAPAPVVEQGISGDVVAAISAAIYSIEGANATVCSIRRKNPVTGRNPWASAAVTDNTRPF